MPHAYTEVPLVEQPAIRLFAEFGWQTVSALEESFGATGTLLRETQGEVVLVSRLRAALERLNPALLPEATRHHFAEFEGDPEILEERKFTLRQIAPREQHAFGYEYDFGDSWEHEITVDKILPPDAAASGTALCLEGARACPPEDCGGVWGYDNLLKVLKNRKHPEHKSMKEWLGRAFDADAFDVRKTNLWLRKLKWPRVTEAQLRKILMGRDDYHE
ncbi:MAG: plasmid pRiA4b ORF-3 family protein [Limisphaerales bacterium]